MAAVPLPSGIEEKLADLSAEMRRLRVIRGASWLALALFALPVAGIALDSSVPMPRYARLLLLGMWVALGALATWVFLVRRMRGEVPPAELAAAIEDKYPSLAERLRTLVELSEHAEPGNGSKALIGVLGRETEKRTDRLNFYRAAPTGMSFRAAAIALVFGAVAVALIFFVRWYTPPVEPAFTVAVPSGEPVVVTRGEPVTLTAFLKKVKPDAVLPDAAVLVFRAPGDTAEKKLPMAGDDKAAFSVTRPKVDADFEYAVECGGVRTDWHPVYAVDRVRVAAGSTTAAVPPEYAAAEKTKPLDGLVEAEVLQHGTIAYDLKFDRPAVAGKLEWRPADAKADPAVETIPLAFNADRTAATHTHPTTTNGTLTLVLTGERGKQYAYPVAVKAIPDAPPKFERVTGLPLGRRDVRPDRPLKLDLVVSDDVGVSKVVVEYTRLLGDKATETKTEVIPLAGLGTREAKGEFLFSLLGKANDGETVGVRVRVTDNRSVPAAGLAPQSVTFPSTDWTVLRLNASAAPISEQEISGQKEAIDARLDAAARKVETATKEVATVRVGADGKPQLTPDQVIRLDQAREKATEAARELEAAADAAALVPELQPLARAAREVSAKHLGPTETQLKKATNEPDSGKRDEATATASDELAKAKDAIDELRKKNATVAQNRISRDKLDDLADEQKRLAEEAAKADAAKAAELAAKQKELRDRLDKLVGENADIKKAAENANKQDAAALAEELQKLKRQQEELDAAARAAADRGKREGTDELKKKQADLATKAAELKKQTDTATRIAHADPLDPKSAADAADKMTGDKPLDALTEQEKAARELDRLADKLAAEAGMRNDAKEAAKQIAQWQDDLRRRAADAAKQNPNGLPPDTQKKLQAEQKAIQKATDRLPLPPSDELQQAKQDASRKAGDAADAVGKPDADAAMKKASDALAKLAEKTPDNAARRAAAKNELEKLRREQDDIAREAADAVKAAEGKNPDDPATRDELAKKLKETAEKQDELAKKLKKLDTPGAETRRDRTAESGEKAGDDLRKGLPQDIPASQADAKRRMDRLRDALAGDTPADDKAGELARLQRQLTDELTKLEKPNADELQRLQRRQKEINKAMADLKAPEAGGEKADARAAGRDAEAALDKKEPDVDELKKKSKAAADAAQKLADKLNSESDQDKLDRLAKNRAEQAQKATDPADRASDPNRTREAQQQLDRDIADLGDVRSGEAQAAKKKAADALERLRRTPEPDKQKELQKQAADAMKELADKVRKNGDRRPGNQLANEPKLDPADPHDPDNGLATEEQAKAARELAKQQRELRDELSKAAEQNAKTPPTPGDKDPLGDLAKEQAEIAKQADELAKKADKNNDAAKQQTKDAAGSAQQAADKLTAGDPTAAGKAGRQTADKLKEASEKGGDEQGKTAAGELAKKQDELNAKIAEAGKDQAAVAARQQRRQQELSAEAKDVADKLDRAAERGQGGMPMPMGDNPLKQAADQARKAGQQMDRAGQEAGKGKPDQAADARKQANESLKQAGDAAGKEAGQPMPGQKPSDPTADAGKAAQQAGDKMAQAQGELGKGQAGKPAQQAMKQAADKLKQAAEQLAKAGQPGDPNGSNPGGQVSGGNRGDPGTPTTDKIPSVVVENLGKSWGDLSGEVKSKILQELSARYGEDYARSIKLYFEQLADRK